MKELISKSDFETALNLPKAPFLSEFLYKFSGIGELNSIYDKYGATKGLEFVDQLLSYFEIQIDCNEEELFHIPKSGSFITISNHPFGGVDGLALIKLVGSMRPDYKLLTNFLLKSIEPINDYFIGVNPFENHKKMASSVIGMRYALQHLKNEYCLGLFPAGEVSTYQNGRNKIIDKEWNVASMKLIKKARVPVIPIYFHGGNSMSFHLLGIIHPGFRTLRLPKELQKQQKHSITVRIGQPIFPSDQDAFKNISQFGDYLRAKTYSLGAALNERKSGGKLVRLKPRTTSVRDGVEKELIRTELSKITEFRIYSHQNFDLYCTPAEKIPHILFEIGRLREITFREEGEGTNKEIDLDHFDQYYRHLFLYDKDAEQIVGSYRLGMGRDIIELYGKKGFYTNSMFRMKDGFMPILYQSIELGRSFIIHEYQKKRLPLYLLWKGILLILMQNPEYKYVLGPVSISNNYSEISKSLIVGFIQRNFYDYNLARFIKPKKKFRIKKKVTPEAFVLLDSMKNDIRKLDRIIGDIEPAIKSAPVLLKKYIHQNAKIISFNIDPNFSNVLDGLMILDIQNTPIETIENLKKDLLI